MQHKIATAIQNQHPTFDEDFDKIIVTAPSNIFSRLLPVKYAKYADDLKKINYLSALVVILVLKRSFLTFIG